MNLRLLIDLSLRSIKANKLRSILTILIIALGITALVAILTSIDGIRISLKEQFVGLGANSFKIINRNSEFDEGAQSFPIITQDQAESFKKRFSKAAVTSIANNGGRASYTVKYRDKKTNPNVTVVGIDENYLQVSGFDMATGRNMSKFEVDNNVPVVLIGLDVAAILFTHKDSVAGKMITIADQKFKVLGLLASKGQSMVASDNQVLIPYKWVSSVARQTNQNYEIFGSVETPEHLDFVKSEAIGMFRSIRKLSAKEKNNFDVSTSDKVINELFENLQYISISTIIIGLLTLLGAGIGLMNIMLVSVNERTREIGVSKALGAKRADVRKQFLIEAIVVCIIGGLFGIVLGVIFGNLVSLILKVGFIVPWNWMVLGLIFCFIVGLVAGIYPAIKAGKLNPVEALRYE